MDVAAPVRCKQSCRGGEQSWSLLLCTVPWLGRALCLSLAQSYAEVGPKCSQEVQLQQQYLHLYF